jgi:hypothetical protein
VNPEFCLKQNTMKAIRTVEYGEPAFKPSFGTANAEADRFYKTYVTAVVKYGVRFTLRLDHKCL